MTDSSTSPCSQARGDPLFDPDHARNENVEFSVNVPRPLVFNPDRPPEVQSQDVAKSPPFDDRSNQPHAEYPGPPAQFSVISTAANNVLSVVTASSRSSTPSTTSQPLPRMAERRSLLIDHRRPPRFRKSSFPTTAGCVLIEQSTFAFVSRRSRAFILNNLHQACQTSWILSNRVPAPRRPQKTHQRN